MKPAMRLANSTTYWMALVMWCAHCCHIHSADWGERHKSRHVIATWSHWTQAGAAGLLCGAACKPCSGTHGFPQVCTAPRWISSCLQRCTDTSPSETWGCSEWCGLKQQQMYEKGVSMWFSHSVLFIALGFIFSETCGWQRHVNNPVSSQLYLSPISLDRGQLARWLNCYWRLHFCCCRDQPLELLANGHAIITIHIHCALYRPKSMPSCSLLSPVPTQPCLETHSVMFRPGAS